MLLFIVYHLGISLYYFIVQIKQTIYILPARNQIKCIIPAALYMHVASPHDRPTSIRPLI